MKKNYYNFITKSTCGGRRSRTLALSRCGAQSDALNALRKTAVSSQTWQSKQTFIINTIYYGINLAGCRVSHTIASLWLSHPYYKRSNIFTYAVTLSSARSAESACYGFLAFTICVGAGFSLNRGFKVSPVTSAPCGGIAPPISAVFSDMGMMMMVFVKPSWCRGS